MFLLPTFVMTTATVLGVTTTIDVTYTMGYGLIIAASASVFGALMSLAKLIAPVNNSIN